MDVQRRYWQEFIDLKRDALYIAFYHNETEQIDRFLNGFSAITSSSAVGGWILWRGTVTFMETPVDFRLVWSGIIMIAQVVTAVKEYLPYKKRLHALAALANDLNSLVIVMESDWFKVSHGILTDQEIHDLHMDMKRRKHEATVKSFGNTSLPEVKRLLDRATADTQNYVRTFFEAKGE